MQRSLVALAARPSITPVGDSEGFDYTSGPRIPGVRLHLLEGRAPQPIGQTPVHQQPPDRRRQRGRVFRRHQQRVVAVREHLADRRQVGRHDRRAGRHVVEQFERRREVARHQVVGQRQDRHAGPGDRRPHLGVRHEPRETRRGPAIPSSRARSRQATQVGIVVAAAPAEHDQPRLRQLGHRRPAACRRPSSDTTGRRTPPSRLAASRGGSGPAGGVVASGTTAIRSAGTPYPLLEDLGAGPRQRQQQVGLRENARFQRPGARRRRPGSRQGPATGSRADGSRRSRGPRTRPAAGGVAASAGRSRPGEDRG